MNPSVDDTHPERIQVTTFKKFKPFKLFKTIAGLLDGLNDLNATLYSSSVLGANSSSNFNFFLVNPCSKE